MTVANTILQQLGGNRFRAMTGSKTFVDHGDALSFRFPTSNKLNYLKITLDPSDTYNLEFGYIRGTTYKPQPTIERVYCDQLQEIFTDKTGLYTRL